MRTQNAWFWMVFSLVLAPGCNETSSELTGGRAPAPGAGADTANGSAADAPLKGKFETTVRPILREHCAACHASTIKPFHSSASVDIAYQEIMTFRLVDFVTPKNSRLYTRLAVDKHQCWSGDCAASSQTILDAIQAWASAGGPPISGPPRHDGPTAAIPPEITQGAPTDMKLNEAATELSFTMASPSQGPVVFSVRVEKFDKYSYRVFWPTIRAPQGVSVELKELLFKLNDQLRVDGSFSLLAKTVEGKGASTPIVLDPTTTLILLMDRGPGSDRLAPSFASFVVK